MRVFRIVFTLFMLSVVVTGYAQDDSILLNDSISEMMKLRAAEKVAQMNDYISYMADKNKDFETRMLYREKALNLFIGKGEPYEEDGQMRSGVYMEISSVYTSKKSRRLMKDYFYGLVNLRYDAIEINSTKVHEIPIGKLQKIDDNKYVCTVLFEQIFVGYRDGIPVYKDRTLKRVRVYIFVEETVDSPEFIVLLGDVEVLETNRI